MHQHLFECLQVRPSIGAACQVVRSPPQTCVRVEPVQIDLEPASGARERFPPGSRPESRRVKARIVGATPAIPTAIPVIVIAGDSLKSWGWDAEAEFVHGVPPTKFQLLREKRVRERELLIDAVLCQITANDDNEVVCRAAEKRRGLLRSIDQRLTQEIVDLRPEMEVGQVQ